MAFLKGGLNQTMTQRGPTGVTSEGPRIARNLGLVLFLFVNAAILSPIAEPGQPDSGDKPKTPREIAKEYGIKGACLRRFPSFVKWPSKAFENEKSPIVIGIIGRDPFGKALDKLIKNETAQGRKMVIRRFSRLEDLAPCHILFISSSERLRLKKILKKVEKNFTLTVADMKGVCQIGVMINFYIGDNKVRFEINNAQARKAGLEISSRLLKMARIVELDKKQRKN